MRGNPRGNKEFSRRGRASGASGSRRRDGQEGRSCGEVSAQPISAFALLLACPSLSFAQPHAVSAPSAAPPDNGNWEMPGKNYASTRFSAMRQVTPANVAKLGLAFTFSTATTHGYEAPPLVVGGTMYLITPFPNYVYALDLTKPGAPTKWVFKPKPLAAARASPVATCQPRRRLFEGQDHLQHARRPDDRRRRRQRQTGLANAPRQHPEGRDDHHGAARRKRQSAGRQFGRRDGRSRLDRGARRRHRQDRLESVQHRTRQGRPDRPRFKPFYASDRGKDLGVKTWPPEAWKIGGATVWGWLSYDPELNLDLLRHLESRSVESRPAARRQQMVDRRFRARRQHRPGGLVSTKARRTICSITTTSTRSSSPTSLARRQARPSCCARRATASSTSRIAVPARC